MAKARIKYLMALAGSFGFYIAYREWLSWLLLVGILGLPWLSLAVSLPRMRKLRISADGPERLAMGDRAQVVLQARGKYLVPPFSGKLRLERTITGETWRYKNGGAVPTEHCGAIRVVPERAFVCDVLGLFRFRVKQPEECWILVLPREVPMENVPDLKAFLARSWRPKPGGGYAENHELRLYRPGDSLNQIHWKLTAKTGKLTIREPMEPNRGLVLLTMDINGDGKTLDRKFGQLLWLGKLLNAQEIPFEIRALTGQGIVTCPVDGETALTGAIHRLLRTTPVREGSILDHSQAAVWHRHMGGEPYEP